MYSYTRDASRCLAILSINTSRLFTEGSVIPPEHRLMLVNFHRECIGDTKKSPVGPRHYQCKVCDKCFSHSGNLAVHMHIHTGDKPYQCKVCDKYFSWPSHLTVHMRTHTGDKPYKCNVWGKGFFRSSHLTHHMRIHTGDK